MPSQQRQIAVANSIVGHSKGREVVDYYPTPPEATRALLAHETFTGTILEPACGDGSMSRVLAEVGDVASSDLFDHGFGTVGVDFVKSSFDIGAFDNVITNPPFKLAQAFAEKALVVAKRKVAMFLKFTFAEGLKRKEFFEKSPLKCIYVFSDRVQLTRGGAPMENSGMICYAWYVWDHNHFGDASIKWLNSREYKNT